MSDVMVKLSTSKADEKRRIVMPPELPPHAQVTIQPLDIDCWIVRLVKAEQNVKLVAIPVIKRLPDDPEWEKKELEAARGLSGRLPPFEE